MAGARSKQQIRSPAVGLIRSAAPSVAGELLGISVVRESCALTAAL